MKQTYLFLMFMLWATLSVAQAPFITTWEVSGSGDDLGIQFGGNYEEEGNYTVDFGDGTILTNQSGVVEHIYSSPGVYTVSVTGDFPMFRSGGLFNAPKLKSVEQWGDIVWKTMEGAFSYCTNFAVNATDVPNLSQVTSMAFMFFNTTSVSVAGIEDWDVSNVTDMNNMLAYSDFFNEPIGDWDVSNVTDMSYLFFYASSFNQPLNSWDVSNVTDMTKIFQGAANFNQAIGDWDVSNITNMEYMFQDASSFNQSLNNWDVSNVTEMGDMFRNASSFNQPLNDWDVSNVTGMISMFSGATNFNQPLDNWDVSGVGYMYNMFSGASSFNQPLNNWDVLGVTNLSGMFSGASSFNQPLNDWDVKFTRFFKSMFRDAISFNQPLDNWDVSNAYSFAHMFDGAVNFNQPLNNWQFEDTKTGGFDYFLNGSGLSTENYDLLLGSLVDIYMSNSMEEILDFGGLGLTYCNMEAHDYLTNTLGWNINDAGVSGTCNIISGGVFFDLNDDGCTESDIPADIFSIEIDNGVETYKRFIQNGEYTFATTEESFTVSLVNLPDYFTVTPEFVEVDFATATGEQVDFCVTANQDINDLNITLLPITEARPGFEATYKLVVKNLGTQSMDNITASLLFDEAMQSFVEANPVASATTTSSLEFAIATLAPFESWETSITMQTFTPPTVNGDDLLNFTATVLPNIDDYTPNDNTFSLEQIVVNSYDPNDKQVLQGETIVMEQTGEYLDYLIRFQNTGSASAINIRVEDELHDNLDWSTLSITSASHDYEVQITNGNEVDFIFNGIYLPAEAQNEPESHGYIAYKIKPKTTVQVGDIMSGNASIYFDYNEPIITNTVTTEVVDVLGVGEYNLSSFITVYPNPINEGIYLEMTDGVELISVKLYNVQGRLLLETKETSNYIKTEQLSSGVYMLRLETNKGQLVKRVVKK